jgi:glycine/D-amino acid oxidase-like deaminating enzyme
MCSLDATGRRYKLLRPGSPRLDEFGIRLFPREEAVLELGAGLVEPASALAALSTVVRQAGVRVVEREPVKAITSHATGLRVGTSERQLRADRVIVAAGPWVHDLVPVPPSPLRVTRQEQLVFATDRPIGNGRPAAWAELVHDDGYGVINGPAGKHIVGNHEPGPLAAPGVPARTVGAEVVRQHLATLRERLVGGTRVRVVGVRLCHYTTTVDARFLIAQCADLPGVILLSACSGHGFKFALTTGYQAAELAAA